jgi:hypothetical protein
MQTSQIVVSVGASVLTLFGGGGVVLIAICGFLSKFVADRTIEGHRAALNIELERVKNELAKETEGHRLKLKKAEILFARELDATSEFSALYRKIRPDYSRPDMEWDDACTIVAGRFPSIEQDIEAYLTKHGPVLTETVRTDLKKCVTYASHNKFGAYEMPEEQADAAAGTAAGKLLNLLESVEVQLFKLVRNEARIE